MPDGSIARIENLRVEFQTKAGTVAGVEDVSFQINPGETVCVVGESGSGKSVSSLSLMRLIDFGGGDIAKGRLLFDRAGGGEIDLAETDPARAEAAVRAMCEKLLANTVIETYAVEIAP